MEKKEFDSYYDLFGVDPTASFDELNKIYRGMARHYHPDVLARIKDPDTKAEGERIMTELNVAMDIFKDPAKRRAYDLTLPNEESKKARGMKALMAMIFDPDMDDQALDEEIEKAMKTFGFTEEDLSEALDNETRERAEKEANANNGTFDTSLKVMLFELSHNPDNKTALAKFRESLSDGTFSLEAFRFLSKESAPQSTTTSSSIFLANLSLLEEALRANPSFASEVLDLTLKNAIHNAPTSKEAASFLDLMTELAPAYVFEEQCPYILTELIEGQTRKKPQRSSLASYYGVDDPSEKLKDSFLFATASDRFGFFLEKGAIGPNWTRQFAEANETKNFRNNNLCVYEKNLSRIERIIHTDPQKAKVLPETTLMRCIGLWLFSVKNPSLAPQIDTILSPIGNKPPPSLCKTAKAILTAAFTYAPRQSGIALSPFIGPLFVTSKPNKFVHRSMELLVETDQVAQRIEDTLLERLVKQPTHGVYRRLFFKMAQNELFSPTAALTLAAGNDHANNRIDRADRYLACLDLIERAGLDATEGWDKIVSPSMVQRCVKYAGREKPGALLSFIHQRDPALILKHAGQEIILPKLLLQPEHEHTTGLFQTMLDNNLVTQDWINTFTKENKSLLSFFHPFRHRKVARLIGKLQKHIPA